MNNHREEYPVVNLKSLSNEEIINFFKRFGFILIKDTFFGEAKVQSYFQMTTKQIYLIKSISYE
jgi:hypothetical protein